MRMKGLFKGSVAAAMAVGALTAGLVLSAPAVSSSAATPTSATWAEPPAATPNFILPYYPAQLCSVDNIEQFQFLMYRPLYWFGTGSSPALNESLSIGQTPTFSG